MPPFSLSLCLLLAVKSIGGGPHLNRCPPASGRGFRTAPGRVTFALALRETGRNLWNDAGLAETAFDVIGRGLLTATDHVDSIRDPLCRSRDRSRSLVRSPLSSDHSRSKEGGQRARLEMQEGVETVAVSQAPAISEAPAAVVPPVGGATIAELLSAV